MIKTYLNTTRSIFQYIDKDKKNRFNNFFEMFQDSLDDDVELHFIQSPKARSEYVKLGDTTHIVIDRQSSLYVNAIDVASFNSETNNTDFTDELYTAFIFIAINECFNLNRPNLAQELHETYILNQYSYFYSLSVRDEIIRLIFTFYHEWGHFMTDKYREHPDLKELEKQINKVFKDHQSSCIEEATEKGNNDLESKYGKPYEVLFNDYNKDECLADLLSASQALTMMEEDNLFRGLMGEAKYIEKSLISIYQLDQVKYIQKLVSLALENDPLPLENEAYKQKRSDLIIQRMRVSRQSLCGLLQTVKGEVVAEETFNKFTDYLVKVDRLSREELFPRLYKFINFSSSLEGEYTKEETEAAMQYCIKELHWRDD